MTRVLAKEYIPAHGIKGLDEYKYTAGAYSLLDNALNPFWLWIANQLPKSMAPNLVTLLGLMFLFSIGLGVFWFDPHFEGKCPPALYVWFAISIWAYGTLDAVDGKQARRTNSSSPLGQLFDHGCDSVGCAFLTVGVCSCMSFGATIWTPIMALTIQLPFYLAQYEEHYAHTVRTQFASFGVTEGQYMEAVLMLVTYALGPEFWSSEVPYTEFLAPVLPSPDFGLQRITLRTVMVYAGCLFPVLLGLSSIGAVLAQKISAAVNLVPMLALDAYLIWSVQWAGEHSAFRAVFLRFPVPFMLVFGLFASHLANRVIIATVCKMDFPSVEWQLFVPLLGLATADWLSVLSSLPAAWQLGLFASFAAWVVFVYLHFALSVAVQIAKHLKIHILTLGRRIE